MAGSSLPSSRQAGLSFLHPQRELERIRESVPSALGHTVLSKPGAGWVSWFPERESRLIRVTLPVCDEAKT